MIRNPYRSILIIAFAFLTIKNLLLVVLLGDFFSMIPALVSLILIYLILIKHRFAYSGVYYWALFYLFIYNGVKAGGKTLVILSGNSWEINKLTYGIDLCLVAIGLLVILIGKRMLRVY